MTPAEIILSEIERIGYEQGRAEARKDIEQIQKEEKGEEQNNG